MRLLLLALLLACKDDEPTKPDGDDTDTQENPDSDAPDLDGTLGEAVDLGDALGAAAPNTEVALIEQADAIDPPADHDFYAVDLEAGVPYLLWVDTGANLRCDTILRVYPPGSTTPATISTVNGEIVADPGDTLAENDDMIYRWRGSDPGMVFVPPTAGAWLLEVAEYNESVGDVALGGPWCSYTLMGMRREAGELECNDLTEVRDALVEADDDTDVGLPGTAPSPAIQPLTDGLFLTPSEELSGWLAAPGDDDVWRVRFGDLGDDELGAFWSFSLWDTLPSAPERRLTLLDENLEVLAQTDDPVPDGHEGFVEDPGILYQVSSDTTYYLRVSTAPSDGGPDDLVSPSPVFLAPRALPGDPRGKAPVAWSNSSAGGDFYLGAVHGIGKSLVDCDDANPEITWWESESLGGARNDSFNSSELMRFCRVGTTDVYAGFLTGRMEPEGLPSRYVRPPGSADPEGPTPDVEKSCGDGTFDECPDREYFAIRQVSGAGGAVAGKRIRISVQARTVGSFVTPEVFLFYNNNKTWPFASSDDNTAVDPAIAIGAPDADIDTIIPSDAEVVYILVQPKTVHPTRTEANSWYLRAIIEATE
jgi:hypothetical protein